MVSGECCGTAKQIMGRFVCADAGVIDGAGVGHFSGSICAGDFVNGALAKHDVGLGIYGGGRFGQTSVSMCVGHGNRHSCGWGRGSPVGQSSDSIYAGVREIWAVVAELCQALDGQDFTGREFSAGRIEWGAEPYYTTARNFRFRDTSFNNLSSIEWYMSYPTCRLR